MKRLCCFLFFKWRCFGFKRFGGHLKKAQCTVSFAACWSCAFRQRIRFFDCQDVYHIRHLEVFHELCFVFGWKLVCFFWVCLFDIRLMAFHCIWAAAKQDALLSANSKGLRARDAHLANENEQHGTTIFCKRHCKDEGRKWWVRSVRSRSLPSQRPLLDNYFGSRQTEDCTILIMLLSLLSLLWFAVHGPVRWASRPPVFATFDLFILYNVVWRLRWLRGHLLAALRKLPTLSCHGDRLLARSLGRFVPVQIFPTWSPNGEDVMSILTERLALHDMELFVSWPTSLAPMIPMVPM